MGLASSENKRSNERRKNRNREKFVDQNAFFGLIVVHAEFFTTKSIVLGILAVFTLTFMDDSLQ